MYSLNGKLGAYRAKRHNWKFDLNISYTTLLCKSPNNIYQVVTILLLWILEEISNHA